MHYMKYLLVLDATRCEGKFAGGLTSRSAIFVDCNS